MSAKAWTSRAGLTHACTTVVEKRLQTSDVDLFGQLPNAKLQTFQKSGHVKTKATESDIIIKADRGLFARMNVIAQHRHMNMQDVLKSLFVMVNCNFRRCPCEDIWSLGGGHFDYR